MPIILKCDAKPWQPSQAGHVRLCLDNILQRSKHLTPQTRSALQQVRNVQSVPRRDAVDVLTHLYYDIRYLLSRVDQSASDARILENLRAECNRVGTLKRYYDKKNNVYSIK